MIAAVPVALALALGAGPAPCAGVVDRTPACAAPADAAPPVAADKKPAEDRPAVSPSILPGELAFLSVGLALGGAGVLAASYANTPRNDVDDHVQSVAQIGGAGLLVWSGLVGASAAALALFDPSTGGFRLKPLFAGSD